MLKIGINLTPFSHYINTYRPNLHNLMHFVIEAEANNIDAIQIYYDKDSNLLSLENLIDILKQTKKFVNICVPIQTVDLSDVLKLKPNMITFSSSLNLTTFEPNPLDLEFLPSDFETIIDRLKNSNVLSSVAINPSVKDVRAIAKVEIDYTLFNLAPIHQAHNHSAEIEEFQKLEMALVAAEKFGFGISLYGELTTYNVFEYNKLEHVEEIYTGKHLFERSVQIGLSPAIQEYTQLLKNI